LFANTDWYLFNFRRALADAIIARGDQVVLVSPAGRYSEKFLAAGYDWRELNFGGRDKSVLKLYCLFRDIQKLYAKEKPDLVHHFTIKCVLFGGLAARLQGIRAVHAITGMGHVLTSASFFMRLARQPVKLLYRVVCRHKRASVIFQNQDDMDYFVDSGLVTQNQAYLIRGSGADCNRFCPSDQKREQGPCRLLFASRLLKEKGVWELLDAVMQLRDEEHEIELLLAGDVYEHNPSSLTQGDIDNIKTMEGVTVLGHVDDMLELFQYADVVVLPSHREGTPRVLLEAGACGKPLIASDIAGCRGVVIPGENGELVPVGDPAALKTAIVKLLDPDLRKRYGRRSREIVATDFSEECVVARTLEVYAAAWRSV
jgi:glycosyltransferase involved in cell wall biosynthesis